MTKQAQPVKVTLNGDGLPTKKRRGSMKTTGSPQIKGHIWQACLRIPDKNGVKHAKSISLGIDATGGKNRRKAEQATAELIAKYNRGRVCYSEPILFADWVKQWLTHHATEVQATTMESYNTYAERDIYPFYSARGTILQDMRGIDVQDFYDYLSERGLCADSIRRYRAVIRGALDYAYKMEMISDNPANRATIPRDPVARPVGQSYTAEQAAKLLAAIKDEPLYPVVFLTLMLALRREEIAGLKWDAIDLENKRVSICHTRTRLRSEIAKDSTKTLSSNRELSLPDSVCDYLKHLRRQQAIDKVAMGQAYKNTEYVARFKDGRPMSPGYISAAFNTLLKKYDLPHIRFHDLRDTAATLMLANGVDLKTIQNYLGHRNYFVTVDRYIHPDFEEKAKAAEKLSQVIQSPA